MNTMKFDPYGFIAPKTRQDYIALLDEAIQMGKNLNDMWEQAFKLVKRPDEKSATAA